MVGGVCTRNSGSRSRNGSEDDGCDDGGNILSLSLCSCCYGPPSLILPLLLLLSVQFNFTFNQNCKEQQQQQQQVIE